MQKIVKIILGVMEKAARNLSERARWRNLAYFYNIVHMFPIFRPWNEQIDLNMNSYCIYPKTQVM